ncbi:hypothetical protein ACFQZ4_11870 [Catellatospora coxensis]
MIIKSTAGGPGQLPQPGDETMLVASVDVEWSKNYKIKNGNRAFCYSVAWLQLPRRKAPSTWPRSTGRSPAPTSRTMLRPATWWRWRPPTCTGPSPTPT